MTEEGLIKQSIISNIRYMNSTGKYGKGKEDAIKYFFELIDECKKNFPDKLISKDCNCELCTWFKKYFGEINGK